MMFGPIEGGKLRNIITHDIIWDNQKAEFSVYRWLHAHAMFDVTCFPTFVGVSDVISSILLIRPFLVVTGKSYEFSVCEKHAVFVVSLSLARVDFLIHVVTVLLCKQFNELYVETFVFTKTISFKSHY